MTSPLPSKEPSAHVARKLSKRRAALIDSASALFNARGIGGTGLADVARELGLKRASLYHYVRDRNELVEQCYARSCEVTARDLAQARSAANGLERLLAFVTAALEPERRPLAVLSELAALPEDIQETLCAADARNRDALLDFVQQGQADGSLRAVDPLVATQCLLGMLAWSQLLPHWQSRVARSADIRRRAASAIIGIFRQGLAQDPEHRLHCAVRAEQFLPTAHNPFDKDAAAQLKRDSLLATASKLFNRHGIESTSIDRITETLGVTKGSIYHHFEDKADLVLKCYERTFDLYDAFAEVALSDSGNGFDAALINAHLNIQAQAGRVSPLMPQAGFEAVPPAHRADFKRRAAQINRQLAQLLSRGVAEEIGRPCDAPMVTHVSAGAFGWIPKWFDGDTDANASALADQVCDLLIHGIARR
ncbi:MAG: TetR family transcriptional regulator [Pseudomonadota bacterium]